MKTDSWRRRNIGLRKCWKSSLDKKKKSRWIVKQVKQPLSLIRRWSSESSYWGVSLFFIKREYLLMKARSQKQQKVEIWGVEISLWKTKTELNRKNGVGILGKYFWSIWSWQPFNNLEINSRISWLHFVNPALNRVFPNSLLVCLLPICPPYLFPLKLSYLISFDSKIRINFD